MKRFPLGWGGLLAFLLVAGCTLHPSPSVLKPPVTARYLESRWVDLPGWPGEQKKLKLELRVLADVLALAARVQAGSEHPLARAVVQAAQQEGLQPSGAALDIHALAGRGVRGRIDGQLVWVGSARMLTEIGVDPQAMGARADALAEDSDPLSELSDSERKAAIKLLKLCRTIADDFEHELEARQ